MNSDVLVEKSNSCHIWEQNVQCGPNPVAYCLFTNIAKYRDSQLLTVAPQKKQVGLVLRELSDECKLLYSCDEDDKSRVYVEL